MPLQRDGILSAAFTMCGFYSGPSFSSLGSFVVAERVQDCVSSSFLSHPFHTTASLVLTLQLAVSKPGKCPLWATGLSRESERGRSVCRLCLSPSRPLERAMGCGSPSLSLSQSPFCLSSIASVSGLSTNPSRGQQSAAA